MIVNFFVNQHCWSSDIHQLNSDILTRHVLVKAHVDTSVRFTYCEQTRKGEIKNENNHLIGHFSVD
ncbi:hypothetical protein EXA13_04010 [Vibrio cincinnatiensis]|nr:hypothetical protein [Vibrio cincinnatiensis]MCG3728711.1 hypothetical protein [Vibrio cincinnatiensis]